VWRFLRVPGAGKGYTIVVAGGREGDLPLTVAGAPEIVRAAMQNGVSIVLDLFDMRLSKADWRRIVTAAVRVLLHENAPHGLRHVFLEEAAEFIPQKPTDWAVYAEIEKLARMGGNSRLGYTLVNQRSQEVSKAILELCENIFLHRQRGKNALENLDKWLSIAGAVQQKEIIASLPELPQGQCWAWIGGDHPKPPLLVKVPAKKSLHPDRRVMRGDEIAVRARAVDVGKFVAGMKGSLVKIEEEAKANDPKLLRAEIAKLKKQMEDAAAAAAQRRDTPDPAAIEAAERHGFERAPKELTRAMEREVLARHTAMLQALAERLGPLMSFFETESRQLKSKELDLAKVIAFTPTPAPSPPQRRAPTTIYPTPRKTATPKAAAGNGELPGPEQRIANSLVTWLSMGHTAPSNAQVAWLAGYSPTSTSYTNPRGALKSKGLVDYPEKDRVSLTDAGAAVAIASPLDGTLLEHVLSKLPGPEQRILTAAADRFPEAAPNEEVAAVAGHSPTSTSYTNPRGALRSKELLTYPSKNDVRAAEWLFS
jgi:uncharacterized protein